ncbi:MAG: winged helix DNA-binding protein [Novosphingobium sp.]|jgi:hypothetical protein|nr:winged helix DNA-binding protein [Novosphingobium sp.]
MPQADFAYGAPADAIAGLPVALALSVFADRAHVRAQMRDDATAAGFRVVEAAGLAGLLADDARPLGAVVLVDCPHVSGAELAALSRLDLRAAQARAHLVVSTSVAALDDVFACMDQSRPQILVDPARAERVVALGRVLADVRAHGLRELSEEDRLMLLRLSEQVARIAERLEGLAPSGPVVDPLDGQAHSLAAPRRPFRGDGAAGADDADAGRLRRATRPALPDPRLVRGIIRQRQARARFFDADLFADPAWDILLDLTAARAEHARVSVTSLCIASGVPPTTALRWIGQMTDAGLLRRVEDEADRRRAFIELTDGAADAMARFFADMGPEAGRMI